MYPCRFRNSWHYRPKGEDGARTRTNVCSSDGLVVPPSAKVRLVVDCPDRPYPDSVRQCQDARIECRSDRGGCRYFRSGSGLERKATSRQPEAGDTPNVTFCPSSGLGSGVRSISTTDRDFTDIRGKFGIDMDAHNDVIDRSQSAPLKGVKPLRCYTTGGSCSWVPGMPSHRPVG
jgi:hypothetical protein